MHNTTESRDWKPGDNVELEIELYERNSKYFPVDPHIPSVCIILHGNWNRSPFLTVRAWSTNTFGAHRLHKNQVLLGATLRSKIS